MFHVWKHGGFNLPFTLLVASSNTIWKGYRTFRKWTLLGEVLSQGLGFNAYRTALVFVPSLFPDCGWNVIRQLPAPTAKSPLAFVRPFPLWRTLSLWVCQAKQTLSPYFSSCQVVYHNNTQETNTAINAFVEGRSCSNLILLRGGQEA